MNLPGAAEDYRYLVSGDSISRGVVYDEEKGKYSILESCFVTLVQERLKGIVRNVSRFGATLIKGIGRLEKEIGADHPRVVLIEYGGNDCDFDWTQVAAEPESTHQPQTDLDVFEHALAETVVSLKQRDMEPVLMTLPPLNADGYLKWVSKHDAQAEGRILKWLGSVTKIYWWQERYSSSIVRIAETTKTKWIDIRGAFLRRPDFNSLICKDGIHPNQAGHELMADAILDYIARNFSFLLFEAGTARRLPS